MAARLAAACYSPSLGAEYSAAQFTHSFFAGSSAYTGAPSINGLGSGGANVGGNSAVVATGDRYEDVTVSRSLNWRAFDPHKDVRYMPNLASRNEMIDQCTITENDIANGEYFYEINGTVMPNGNKQAVLWNFSNVKYTKTLFCNNQLLKLTSTNDFSVDQINLVKQKLGVNVLNFTNPSNIDFHYHPAVICPDNLIPMNFPEPSNQDWLTAFHIYSRNRKRASVNIVIAFDHNVYIYGYEHENYISIKMTWDQFKSIGQ